MAGLPSGITSLTHSNWKTNQNLWTSLRARPAQHICLKTSDEVSHDL